MKRTRITDFDYFASKNDWLKLYDTDSQAGYVLPDGTMFIIQFDESHEITAVIDSTGEECTCDNE